jgi:hypothetical protein
MTDRQAVRLGARRDAAVDEAAYCRKLAAEMRVSDPSVARMLIRAAGLHEAVAQALWMSA